ncbi:hypothetical protein K488DRAFT_60979 [Vararia minispora EC-137]|uniref:Uncharacterized protein n=1 Tax=Vararia minispora EC-137 TaxID=1314806 RepID=A0ACB8Q7K0_9AGAM|nr:hypothetical protein K488DRAFT_60979 [Vararia minispora EC-137]
MPVEITDQESYDGPIPEDTYRVLLTGFAPFGKYKENNSWLAVAPLNSQLLTLDVPDVEDYMEEDIDPESPENPNDFFHPPRHIHISSILLPVAYSGVVELVPPLHARPPVILPTLRHPNHPLAPPPESGYDLIFHVGLAGRGGLRVERLGHKTGYRMKDSIGEQAPIPAHVALQEPARGFGGEAYKGMADDLYTGLDVERLVHDLKAMGLQDVYSSMDAGHFVCDYTYYCSLAETKRTAQNNTKGKHTKVLFMHCPPANQPFPTEEVTETIKKMIVWVSQQQDE